VIKLKGSNSNSVVHVKLDRSIYIRKEILKTAIDTTKMLYNYKEILELKEMQSKLINKYALLYKDIVKLQKVLSDSDLPTLPSNFENIPHEDTHEFIEETEVNSDVDKLMSELKEVEKKLKSL